MAVDGGSGGLMDLGAQRQRTIEWWIGGSVVDERWIDGGSVDLGLIGGWIDGSVDRWIGGSVTVGGSVRRCVIEQLTVSQQ